MSFVFKATEQSMVLNAMIVKMLMQYVHERARCNVAISAMSPAANKCPKRTHRHRRPLHIAIAGEKKRRTNNNTNGG